MNDQMIDFITNRKLLNLLVALSVARPDYSEALGTVATACGIGNAYAAAVTDRQTQLIIVERPDPARITGGAQ